MLCHVDSGAGIVIFNWFCTKELSLSENVNGKCSCEIPVIHNACVANMCAKDLIRCCFSLDVWILTVQDWVVAIFLSNSWQEGNFPECWAILLKWLSNILLCLPCYFSPFHPSSVSLLSCQQQHNVRLSPVLSLFLQLAAFFFTANLSFLNLSLSSSSLFHLMLSVLM